jgi:hypothetical protein
MRLFILTILALLGYSSLQAGTHRALLIGINQYLPQAKNVTIQNRNWSNLDGSVNDIMSVRALLTARFGFQSQHIRILTNQDATREAIMGALASIYAESQPGDIVFFYYAGHGSQVYNSKSALEKDLFDESLVPADAWKGTRDIRDKELNLVFAGMLEKGIRLTVIFDSCHSGSITRSQFMPRDFKARVVGRQQDDVADPYVPVDLVAKGALVISAAQDYELAKEFIDQDKQAYGAFSYALVKALQAASVHEPASVLFKRLTAVMRFYQIPAQNPVIEGSAERLNGNFLGVAPGELSGKTVLPLIRREMGTNRFQLGGGFAIGLREGCLLELMQGGDLQLKVVEVQGLDRCLAELETGDPESIAPGELFTVKAWAESDISALQLWAPAAPFNEKQLLAYGETLTAFAKSEGLSWCTDPVRDLPDLVLAYHNKQWVLSNQCGATQPIRGDLTATRVRQAMATMVRQACGTAKPLSFYWQVPPVAGLVTPLENALKAEPHAIVLATDVAACHYLLTGQFRDGTFRYAWMLPDITTHTQGKHYVTPITTWVAPNAQELSGQAAKLARIRAWLTLESPPNEANFPYHLALREAGTGRIVTDSVVAQGQIFGLVLLADAQGLQAWDKDNRFVYVYAIDKDGKIQLLFPRSGSSVENATNQLAVEDGRKYRTEIRLGPERLFRVAPPFGTDHYLLFTSKDPLPSPIALEQDAVYQQRSAALPPFANILYGRVGGARTRGMALLSPPDWSVQKISIVSRPQE